MKGAAWRARSHAILLVTAWFLVGDPGGQSSDCPHCYKLCRPIDFRTVHVLHVAVVVSLSELELHFHRCIWALYYCGHFVGIDLCICFPKNPPCQITWFAILCFLKENWISNAEETHHLYFKFSFEGIPVIYLHYSHVALPGKAWVRYLIFRISHRGQCSKGHALIYNTTNLTHFFQHKKGNNLSCHIK